VPLARRSTCSRRPLTSAKWSKAQTVPPPRSSRVRTSWSEIIQSRPTSWSGIIQSRSTRLALSTTSTTFFKVELFVGLLDDAYGAPRSPRPASQPRLARQLFRMRAQTPTPTFSFSLQSQYDQFTIAWLPARPPRAEPGGQPYWFIPCQPWHRQRADRCVGGGGTPMRLRWVLVHMLRSLCFWEVFGSSWLSFFFRSSLST
jgi:hypothetical protein